MKNFDVSLPIDGDYDVTEMLLDQNDTPISLIDQGHISGNCRIRWTIFDGKNTKIIMGARVRAVDHNAGTYRVKALGHDVEFLGVGEFQQELRFIWSDKEVVLTGTLSIASAINKD